MFQQNKFFETIKIEQGKVFHLEYHQKRVNYTFRHFFSDNTILNLKDVIRTDFDGLTRAKIIYDSNNTEVLYFDYKPKNIHSLKLVDCDDILYNFKFFDRSAIDTLSLSSEADEIAIFKNGLLCDSSIANIAIFINGVWISPSKPLLFGTTLRRYTDLNFIKFGEINKMMMYKAEKIAFLNAMLDIKIYDKLEIIC